ALSNAPSSSSTSGSSTLSPDEIDVLMALSNAIGLLPPLPPSLDALPNLLPPPPPPSNNNSGSTVDSQAKRPHDGKGNTPSSSPPPRAHTSDKSPAKRRKLNPFIDLEAEEDLRENADILDDTEGEDEFDDFIDDREVASDEEPPTARPLIDDAKRDTQRDGEVPGEEDEDLDDKEFSDNEYPPTAAAISHRALASHDDMEQWRSLLARACERAREHQPAYVRPPPESFDDGLKALPPALLYRVRVKDGYEETAAMVLANKLLMAGTHFTPSVKSIIGRVSCPGWIFIESDGADASKLCANVSDVYPRHIHPIVEDLQQYLHEPLIAPKEGDWIRLNSPLLYRGDLAYVRAYNDTSADRLTTERKNPGGEGADVLVVPRVERYVDRTKGKGRAGRPPRQLLGRKEAIRRFGANAVKVHHDADTVKADDNDDNDDNKLIFTYCGQKYGDGLLHLVTHDFETTVPTHEELALFQRCSFVDPGDIARAINEIATLPLRVTDRVVVTSGELISMTGTIAQFSGNDKEATIRLDSTEVTMDVVLSPRLLRKVVQVADRVRVVGGAGDGRVGWVVAVDGTELHVWEDKTALP
ncbi:hypothetical protein DXG01_009290, partial [Tephrocybe rancida]